VLRLVSEPDRVGGRSDMALALLAEGLLDPHPGALAAALRGYGRLATEEELLTALKPLLDEASEPERTALAIRELARNSSPRAVSLLDRLAGSGPARVREEAVRALAAVGRPEGLPALERALADHALTVRNAALEGLLEMGRAGRVELRRLVFWLLRSPELDVRRQALEIAAELGDPDDDLWPSMLELLRDEDWWVRERVVEVLVEIGGHKLTPWVAQLLEDESGVLRRHAVEILMRLRDPRALGALLRCAREDEDWWVRERAVEALGEGGDSRVVPHVIKLAASDSELLGAALIALGKLGDDRGLPLVRRGLVHDDPGVRRQALRASASLGGDACLSAVEPLLEDPLYEVRKLAEEIVIGWTGKLEPRSGSISRRLRGLDLLLWQVGESGGDDLLLGAGRKPHLRLGDEVVPMVDLQFSAEQVENSLRPLLSPAQLDALEAGRDVDLSLEVPSAGLRFRTHVFRDRGGWAGVFRRIREELHTLDDLGVPAVAGTWCALSDGLVLVAGPRGSGRSTTLAALVNHVNVHRDAHVVTVEDPIEVVHAGVRSLVTQREVGTHSRDWAFALRSTLRQDADVIVVGELDGPGALEFALSAAETGHLVFAGVAGASASAAIARLVAGFEAEGRARVCARLARSLRAVLAQQLLPRFDGRGSALASEVLLGGDSVADTIRDGQLARLPVLLSAAPPPMVSMDRDLARLVREGTVSADVVRGAAGRRRWRGLTASCGSSWTSGAAICTCGREAAR
jgi:twitching motility protein PilT